MLRWIGRMKLRHEGPRAKAQPPTQAQMPLASAQAPSKTPPAVEEAPPAQATKEQNPLLIELMEFYR